MTFKPRVFSIYLLLEGIDQQSSVEKINLNSIGCQFALTSAAESSHPIFQSSFFILKFYELLFDLNIFEILSLLSVPELYRHKARSIFIQIYQLAAEDCYLLMTQYD